MSQRIICCHILPNLSWVYQPILCPDLINSLPYGHTPTMNSWEFLSFVCNDFLRNEARFGPNVGCCMWHSTSAATQGMMREQVSVTVNKASRSSVCTGFTLTAWPPHACILENFARSRVQSSTSAPNLDTNVFSLLLSAFSSVRFTWFFVFLSSIPIISCFGCLVLYQ